MSTPDLDRLQQVLDACGPDPARWPPHERAALLKLAQADAQAARRWRQAQALEELLRADVPPGDDAALAARILQQATATAPAANDNAPRRWLAAALMAASLLLGLGLGASGLLTPAPDDELDALVELATPVELAANWAEAEGEQP